jgi:hypothetical protein
LPIASALGGLLLAVISGGSMAISGSLLVRQIGTPYARMGTA